MILEGIPLICCGSRYAICTVYIMQEVLKSNTFLELFFNSKMKPMAYFEMYFINFLATTSYCFKPSFLKNAH